VPSMTPPKRSPVTGPVVLQTEKLFKTYGKRSLFQPKARVVAAVKDVSLTIRRGETLGIVGESGSGKSTVARCVARLVDTSAGGIKIDGVDIAAMREAANIETEFFIHAEAAFALWEMQLRERNTMEATEVARRLALTFPENRQLAKFLESHDPS